MLFFTWCHPTFLPNHFSKLPRLCSVLTVSFNIFVVPHKMCIVCKLSNCNPDDRMKSTNECAEYYWSRIISLTPRVWVQQAAWFYSMGTASSLILHSSHWRLSPFPGTNTTSRIFYFISQNRYLTDTQTAHKIIPRYY